MIGFAQLRFIDMSKPEKNQNRLEDEIGMLVFSGPLPEPWARRLRRARRMELAICKQWKHRRRRDV
jgi:hypothetical protein